MMLASCRGKRGALRGGEVQRRGQQGDSVLVGALLDAALQVADGAHAEAGTPGLEGGNFLKFRRFCLQPLVQGKGKHAPAVLGTPFHAAFVAFADAVEPAGIGNRQGTEHHRVDQRKYCRGPAYSQGQR